MRRGRCQRWRAAPCPADSGKGNASGVQAQMALATERIAAQSGICLARGLVAQGSQRSGAL